MMRCRLEQLLARGLLFLMIACLGVSCSGPTAPGVPTRGYEDRNDGELSCSRAGKVKVEFRIEGGDKLVIRLSADEYVEGVFVTCPVSVAPEMLAHSYSVSDKVTSTLTWDLGRYADTGFFRLTFYEQRRKEQDRIELVFVGEFLIVRRGKGNVAVVNSARTSPERGMSPTISGGRSPSRSPH